VRKIERGASSPTIDPADRVRKKQSFSIPEAWDPEDLTLLIGGSLSRPLRKTSSALRGSLSDNISFSA
jgi:hypothetical protein